MIPSVHEIGDMTPTEIHKAWTESLRPLAGQVVELRPMGGVCVVCQQPAITAVQKGFGMWEFRCKGCTCRPGLDPNYDKARGAFSLSANREYI